MEGVRLPIAVIILLNRVEAIGEGVLLGNLDSQYYNVLRFVVLNYILKRRGKNTPQQQL